MNKIDGERLPSQPEKEAAGEEFFDAGRDVNGKDNEVDTDCGVALADIDAWRENVVGQLEHVVGPDGPFGVFARVSSDEETRGEEKYGYNPSRPFPFFKKFPERNLVRQIAEEHAVHALQLESFYSC